MSPKLMQGKRGVILGVANNRSIAWGIAKACHDAGAEIALTFQGEALKKRVEPLTKEIGGILLGHAALEFNRAAHRIDGAGKLDQHSVTRSLDDVAAMRRDCGVDKRCSDRL